MLNCKQNTDIYIGLYYAPCVQTMRKNNPISGSTNYRTDVRRRMEAYGGVWRRTEAYGGLCRRMEAYGGVRTRMEAYRSEIKETYGGGRRRMEA